MGAHIVRIDKPKNSSKGTHGWQVRAGGKRKYHSKLFSDNVYGSKGKALVAAEGYLDQYVKKNPEHTEPPYPHHFREEGLMSNNKSGVNGVCRSWGYPGWDKKKEYRMDYWSAFCGVGPQGQRNSWHKRYYVNTHGEYEAKRLAIEFRKGWEEAIKEGEDALEEFFQREHFDKITYDNRFGRG
ncbi:MAG TPA: hypothetical protein G4N96_11025 [Chloroflexi bacterium]|nr:hypothetical protein [Chloroflexota bacterium]